MMLDLQPFCGNDPFRPYLHKPFSEGEFTYATNGHILVRVPRRRDVGAMEGKPEKFFPENVLKGRDTLTFVAPTLVTTAPKRKSKEADCFVCDGRGTEHDCPDCDCTCGACDGTGTQQRTATVSTEWAGAILDAHYVSLMLDLPGLRLAATTGRETPLQFEFDGGIGAVMPMRAKAGEHLTVFGEPQAA